MQKQKTKMEEIESSIIKFKEYCYDEGFDMILDAYFADIEDPELTEEIKRRCIQVAQSAFIYQEALMDKTKEDKRRNEHTIAMIEQQAYSVETPWNAPEEKLKKIKSIIRQHRNIINFEKNKNGEFNEHR